MSADRASFPVAPAVAAGLAPPVRTRMTSPAPGDGFRDRRQGQAHPMQPGSATGSAPPVEPAVDARQMREAGKRKGTARRPQRRGIDPCEQASNFRASGLSGNAAAAQK